MSALKSLGIIVQLHFKQNPCSSSFTPWGWAQQSVALTAFSRLTMDCTLFSCLSHTTLFSKTALNKSSWRSRVSSRFSPHCFPFLDIVELHQKTPHSASLLPEVFLLPSLRHPHTSASGAYNALGTCAPLSIFFSQCLFFLIIEYSHKIPYQSSSAVKISPVG